MAAENNRPNRGLAPSHLLVTFGAGKLSPRGPMPAEGVRHAAPDEIPPALAALAEPWTERARQLLRSRVSAEHFFFAGVPLPLDALEAQLSQRLTAFLTQTFAATEGDSTAFAALEPLLRRVSHDWAASTATFLERLRCDGAAQFGISQHCAIRGITGTDSDPHGGGHVVLKLVFTDGTVFFYKPRPLTGEWLWSTLLRLVEACNTNLAMPRSLVLLAARGRQYGWAQSIPGELNGGPLPSSYWQRAGALLCLAQHMHMTDLHLGNLLPTTCGPAVTDAECLATPDLGPELEAFSAAQESLIATGLLPVAMHAGPDVSGLFGRGGPVESLLLPGWTVTAAGSWRFEPREAEFAPTHELHSGGSPISVLPQMIEGYREAAATLLRVRQKLLAAGSPWRRVLEQDHAPRMVLRETLTYSQWISRSLAPVHLRSAAGRRRAIAASVRNASRTLRTPAILRAEARALFAGEVPRFIIPAGTRTLASSVRHPVAPRFTATTPAQAVLSSIASLSPRTLDEVLIPALIHAALASRR